MLHIRPTPEPARTQVRVVKKPVQVEKKGHGRLAAFQAKLLLRGLALLLAPLQPCLVSARRRTGQVVPDADKAHVERTPADARTRLRIEVVTAFNEGDAGGTVTHHAARVPHTV